MLSDEGLDTRRISQTRPEHLHTHLTGCWKQCLGFAGISGRTKPRES